jgi:5-methyltetrahydrofolate--homocysteine methyltransferase
MTSHIRALAEFSPFPVACVPNAGFPDENGVYTEVPSAMGEILSRFAEKGWLNLIGGCCGTSPEHIAHFARLAPTMAVRSTTPRRGSFLSGVDFIEVTDEKRPMIVAERTNVIGSRKFKRLISEGALDEAADIARAQAKGGAVVVDVCLANPDRDEVADTEAFYPEVVKRVKLPLMIDTTNPAVVRTALKWCQGKAIINSVNLEDGRGRIDETVPLVKQFGAALVVGCIDDTPGAGMAVTRVRKLEVARRSYELLVEEHGLVPEDLYFDPLVFPCATGDEKYVGSARETIEGIRLIKEAFPGVRTVLGISNVSFGLPAAGREVLNSVFLHYCVEAGLDLALVNAEKLVRFASLSAEEIALADGVLFTSDEASIHAFADAFRESRVKARPREELSLDERLAEYIVDGAREGLAADLEAKLAEASALEIINGPLMAGMDTVGKLFNDNQLIVAEVLQSAETMKAAVSFLEPHLETHEATSRGTLLLATVKGDVHDIGKNLVEIILGNNGFRVIDLGIKVGPEALIEAVREHQPDLIGLSGLLVKSAIMMETTAGDLRAAGIEVPLLVGGAALSERFTVGRIATAYGGGNPGDAFYCKDAMAALEIANRALSAEGRASLRRSNESARAGLAEESASAAVAPASSVPIGETVRPVEVPPAAPDFDRHLVEDVTCEAIWPCLNQRMLLTKHLGVKGAESKALVEAENDDAARASVFREHASLEGVWNTIQEVKAESFGGRVVDGATDP